MYMKKCVVLEDMYTYVEHDHILFLFEILLLSSIKDVKHTQVGTSMERDLISRNIKLLSPLLLLFPPSD